MNVTKSQLDKTADEEQTLDIVPYGYSGTIYMCSMHPRLRSIKKGSCPKCGMFLVLEGEVAEYGQHESSSHTQAQDVTSVDVKDGEYDTLPEGYNATIYTCLMHAQVLHPEPGSCPICAMALEPETISLKEEGPHPELDDFTHRFWVGAVLTVTLLVLAMGPFVDFMGVFGERTPLCLELVLVAIAVILWSGWPVFVRVYRSFRMINPTRFSLVSIGVGASCSDSPDR